MKRIIHLPTTYNGKTFPGVLNLAKSHLKCYFLFAERDLLSTIESMPSLRIVYGINVTSRLDLLVRFADAELAMGKFVLIIMDGAYGKWLRKYDKRSYAENVKILYRNALDVVDPEVIASKWGAAQLNPDVVILTPGLGILPPSIALINALLGKNIRVYVNAHAQETQYERTQLFVDNKGVGALATATDSVAIEASLQ